MSPFSALIVQSTISVFCSCLLLIVLRKPLTHTLARLCPDTDAAAFWWAYASTMLVAGPLALVLLVNLFAPGVTTVDQLRAALLACLGGLLWGMHLLGRRIGAFVPLPNQPMTDRAVHPHGTEVI